MCAFPAPSRRPAEPPRRRGGAGGWPGGDGQVGGGGAGGSAGQRPLGVCDRHLLIGPGSECERSGAREDAGGTGWRSTRAAQVRGRPGASFPGMPAALALVASPRRFLREISCSVARLHCVFSRSFVCCRKEGTRGGPESLILRRRGHSVSRKSARWVTLAAHVVCEELVFTAPPYIFLPTPFASPVGPPFSVVPWARRLHACIVESCF